MSTISELSSIPGQVLPSMSSDGGGAPRTGGSLDLLLILKKHLRLAGLVALGVMLLGAVAVHHFVKPMYGATSIVYVSPNFPAELPENLGEHNRTYDSFVEQQTKAVTRYETLLAALRIHPQYWNLSKEHEQVVIANLQNALVVTQVGHSYEVSITLDSRTKYHLADLINDITTAYLEATRRDEVYGQDQRVATLQGEKDALRKQLDSELQRQDQLLQEVGMARYDGAGPNPYDSQLTRLREQLADAHEKRAEADAASTSLGLGAGSSSGAPSKTLDEAATREINGDSALSNMRSQLQNRKAQLVLQMSGLTPSNPVFIQSQAEIADIDQQLQQYTGDAKSKTADQIRVRNQAGEIQAHSLESQLTRDLEKTRAQAISAVPKLQEAQVLQAEIDRLQKDYAAVESRIEDLSLESNSPGSVHLFSSALPPDRPEKGKEMFFYAGMVLLGLIAGMVAALIAEAIDPHVYTSRDVRKVVGFPPIGVLLNTTEYAPEVQKEYFLRLASGLDQAYRRAGARTFVFPSMGRAGTRELVQLVGSELAANGLHVLVVNVLGPREKVDTGTLRPEVLGLASGAAELTTEFGNEPFRIVALQASEISDVLRRSRSYYNTILVAADPLFTSAYTEHFTRIADGTVLIVNSGTTKKEELARAARLLERLKIKGIAIVLTGVTEKTADQDVARTLQEYKWKTA
jgi:uncharacterized protein involved in exopolysaccharide biosynthesis